MDQDDLAPFIGRIVLENLVLSKEVERLRERVAELESLETVPEVDDA
jgi:regulator of replication initiation timing